MEISTKIRIITILIVFTILGLLVLYFIHKYKSNSPADPSISSNISKGGVFLVGPSSISGQPLIYRDKTDKYYNAGDCTDCPSACSAAIIIQDINKTVCTPQECNPVLISSAQDVTNSYLIKAGKNVMTQVDCSVVIDTSGDPNSTYANQQAISLISQAANSRWVSLWDFISAHSEQIISVAEQLGMQYILSKVIGEYAIVVLLLPGLLGSDATVRYTSGVQIGLFGGKAVLDSLTGVALSAGFTAIQEQIAKTAGKTCLEMATEGAAAMVAETTARMAARSIYTVLEAMGEFLNPLFDILGLIMIAGMILDMVDPCGLNNTLSKDDITATQRAFDYAMFTTLLQAVGKSPVEWYAENIQDYGLICPISDTQSTTLGTLSRSDINYLSRAENIFGGTGVDECKAKDRALSLSYTSFYQNSLTINSVGQCIRPLRNDELEQKCSDALGGYPVTLPTGTDVLKTGMFDQFQKAINYASLQLADGNTVVANFLETYWYVVVILLLIILLISFFL